MNIDSSRSSGWAESETDYGSYFQWGATEGHLIGDGFNCSGEQYASSPAAEIDTNLEGSDDAASVVLGSTWRMPTQQEYAELIAHCDHAYVTKSGIKGIEFTSRENGAKIFFPATGTRTGTDTQQLNENGSYWTATVQTATYAFAFLLTSENQVSVPSQGRYQGHTIRAIRNP